MTEKIPHGNLRFAEGPKLRFWSRPSVRFRLSRESTGYVRGMSKAKVARAGYGTVFRCDRLGLQAERMAFSHPSDEDLVFGCRPVRLKNRFGKKLNA